MGRLQLCGGLFGTSFEAKYWLSFDPCGTLGILLSYGAHGFAASTIAIQLLGHSVVAKFVYFGLYLPAAFLACASLFRASTVNPGAVPLGAQPLVIVKRAGSSPSPRRGVRRCHKCHDNYKPPRAHHDSVSGRCIVKFDHFCPWVNNAIGALNHKYFCLFLLYTAITCVFSLLLLLIRFIQCGYIYTDQEETTSHLLNGNFEEPSVRQQGSDGETRFLSQSITSQQTSYVFPECHSFNYNNHWLVALLITTLVFLVFSVSMGCEQLEAIETGRGKIARMKMSSGSSGTEFAAVSTEFNEMFGGNTPHVQLHWFNPFVPVRFPRGMKKVVLGYEWDESFEPVPFAENNNTNNCQEADDCMPQQSDFPILESSEEHGSRDELLNCDVESGLRTATTEDTTKTLTSTALASILSSNPSTAGGRGGGEMKNRKQQRSRSPSESAEKDEVGGLV